MKRRIKHVVKNFIGDAGTRNLLDRQIWVMNALSSLPNGSKLLDAGAGECQYKKHCTHLNYVSQDFCAYEGTGNNKGLQTGKWDITGIDIVSDILEIPQQDKSFDYILCTEVFEHIPDPISALKEFYRLLKDGGELLVTAPFNSLTHFAPFHYYSGFNSYFYEYHLKKLGFEIIEISANGNISEYLAQEVRRLLSLYGKPPLHIKLSVWLILRYIKVNRFLLGKNDLGCFGFHVRAKKI